MKLMLLGLAALSAADLMPPLPVVPEAPRPIITTPSNTIVPISIPDTPVVTAARRRKQDLPAVAATTWPAQPAQVAIRPVQTVSTQRVVITSLAQAQSILRQMSPNVRSMGQMSTAELQAYRFAYLQFMTPERIRRHSEWHAQNGQGTGTAFLVMHRGMLMEFETFVGGGFNVPQLLPGEIIGPELAVDANVVLQYGARQSSSISAHVNPITEWGAELNTLNLFGQAISDDHRLWHRELGGVMIQLGESPLDPVFLMLHAYIDALTDEWLYSAFGAPWAAQNRQHPIFAPYEMSSAYSNARFASEDTCALQQTILCTQIAQANQALNQASQALGQPVFVDGGPFMGRGFGPMRGWQPPRRARPPRRGPRW